MTKARLLPLFAYLLAVPVLISRQIAYGRLANEVRVATARLAGARIGKGVTMRPRVVLKGCKNLTIGDNVFIGENTSIVAYGGKIKIGDDTIIADHVYISGRNHRFRSREEKVRFQGYKPGDVAIGRDVWLAHGVLVLAGSSIADGSVVSAGMTAPNRTFPYQVVFRHGIGNRS